MPSVYGPWHLLRPWSLLSQSEVRWRLPLGRVLVSSQRMSPGQPAVVTSGYPGRDWPHGTSPTLSGPSLPPWALRWDCFLVRKVVPGTLCPLRTLPWRLLISSSWQESVWPGTGQLCSPHSA